MKRIAGASVLTFVCLVLISSMGCGGSSSKPSTTTTPPSPESYAITATSGSGQSTASGTSFSAPLVATVTVSGIRMSGIKVTFTAPTSGPSGTFANGTAMDTEITDASGKATSSVFTANKTGGAAYTVTASVSGAPNPVSFTLTNVSSTSYVFFASGQEAINSSSFYAIAGSVSIDASGNVLGGEQDYNDGSVATSPQPSGDAIQGGSLSFPAGSPSGQGTLALITNNISIGVPNSDGVTSTETFGIQFVNADHALIMQFDGSATSSGSLDLQTLTSTPSGGYAFTFSGIDNGSPFSYGGVFSVNGSSLTGTIDVNDVFNIGSVLTGVPLSGQISGADSSGRGTITGFTNSVTSTPIAINYYLVGPKAIRIIDVDATDTAVGSAFSQGSGTFSNASLGTSVLAIAGNVLGNFGALGQFTTTNTSSATSNFSGVGEDSEPANGIGTAPASKFSGTYTIGSNGYGDLLFTINPNTLLGFGNIGELGIYMTDPALNLSDPNNSVGRGGALIMDLDGFNLTSSAFPGGTGVIVPQTDTTAASFNGNYAAGWQNFNFNFCGCEFDMIAQGTMVANGALSLTGLVSDTSGTLTGTPGETQGDTFTGTPLPDTKNPGRYAMTAAANSLSTVIGGAAGPTFQMTIYQANGGQLFWLGYDLADITGGGSPAYVSLGPIEQQSLTGIPAARKPAAKAKTSKKR
jgi:hypothetical protein